MPRVLRIINRFNLGGPTYNAAYLSKYMAPEFETLLVGGANDETEENSEFIVRNLGLEPLSIPEMKRPISLKDDLTAYYKLRKIIRDFKPDIVHTHAAKAGALGRRAAHYLKVPVIVHTFHGHVFDAYFGSMQSTFYQQLERRLAKMSTKIIAISENQKYDLVHKYRICPEEKVEIIPLGFDLGRFNENIDIKRIAFRKKYQIEEDEIAIGIVGRIVPIKNHAMFLKSIALLKEKTQRNIRVFVVGDGELINEVVANTTELGLDYTFFDANYKKASITFTSWIKDIDEVNAGMDIIALTSLNEGTPVSLIEAQASNKPIVTTDVGGIANVVIPNKTAFLCESGNHEQFADYLLQLVDNDQLRIDMGIEGWDFVREKFHYQRLVNDMKNFYNRLLV
ncbi:MAG: glycosyltransferase [Bacteroidota bacterium]